MTVSTNLKESFHIVESWACWVTRLFPLTLIQPKLIILLIMLMFMVLKMLQAQTEWCKTTVTRQDSQFCTAFYDILFSNDRTDDNLLRNPLFLILYKIILSALTNLFTLIPDQSNFSISKLFLVYGQAPNILVTHSPLFTQTSKNSPENDGMLLNWCQKKPAL